MDIKVYEKPIITKFVMIDGVEFELRELLAVLNQLFDTIDYDGELCMEYPLRDYELYDYEITKELVKMGLILNYTGSRMADLYIAKDKSVISKLIEYLEELY